MNRKNNSENPVIHTENNMKPQITGSGSVAQKLKGYLVRLGAGEDLESVRMDFAEIFSGVEASEIMRAEQELMREGTPLKEVQKLCDVHSALFHGATKEERIANAEMAVEESLKRESEKKLIDGKDYSQKHSIAKSLREVEGHPLNTLSRENNELARLIGVISDRLENGDDISAEFESLRQLSVHYAKKGDLLYPHLKVRYQISGPSDVMWTVDDEIRDELAAIGKSSVYDERWKERLKGVLKRAEEMIYKEENILFPICAVNFTEDEWYGIYHDSKDYDAVFGVRAEWESAENNCTASLSGGKISNGEVILNGGKLTVEQLTAMLNTLPVEISFVDENDINRYFNEGAKAFKRPQMALGREVYSCHPPKVEQMVRAILGDLRSKKRDSVPVWMEKSGKPFLVTYMAVRDRNGTYLGTVEVVQDMTFAKKHFVREST